MRDRSLPELTGMGTWLIPKGVGCCRPWRRMGRARICCRGWACGSSSEVSEHLRTLLLAHLLNLEVIDRPGLLHAVQRLNVAGPGGPRGVAVRASARLGTPAHQMRSHVESAFYGPGRADESSACSRHRQASRRRTHGSRRRQGSFAQCRQHPSAFGRRSRFRRSRRRLRSSREAFRCFRLRELLGSEALDVLGGLALHLRRSLPRSLQHGLHFAGPSDDLRGRHFVRRGGQSRWPPWDSQSPVPKHIHRLVLRYAPRRRSSACSRAGDHRLRRLDAAFAEPAPQCRGPGRVQPVVAQRLTGIGAPVVAVGQEGRPRELSGRAREGDPIVALVGGLERSRRIDARVGQRRLADGLGCVGVSSNQKCEAVNVLALRLGKSRARGSPSWM